MLGEKERGCYLVSQSVGWLLNPVTSTGPERMNDSLTDLEMERRGLPARVLCPSPPEELGPYIHKLGVGDEDALFFPLHRLRHGRFGLLVGRHWLLLPWFVIGVGVGEKR